MDIRLELYRTFHTVAECGSFSEAAKSLYITQSAVSQQISALENQLGTILFKRNRKGAQLTESGKLLFSYTEKSLGAINDAEGLFTRLRDLDEGSLKIGAGDTITRYVLIPALRLFHQKYPKIKVEIVNRVTSETLKKLEAGSVDVAFVNLPIEQEKYRGIEIFEAGELHEIFVVGKEYSYLKDKTLSVSELASLPLVMLEPKSNTRKSIDDFFLKNKVVLKPEFELGSHDLLFDFAENGLGIACVTEEYAEDYISDGKIFKINTDFVLPSRKIGICTVKNSKISPAVEKFTEMFV